MFHCSVAVLTSADIPAARCRVRVLQFGVPLEVRGRREYRALNRTRNPRGLTKRTPTSRQVGPKSHGTPCAMALRLTPRSPWGTGLFSPHRQQIISVRLIPASGDQDHTA